MAIFETLFGFEMPDGLGLAGGDHAWQAFPLFHLPASTLEQLGVFPSFVRAYQFEREYYHEQWEEMRQYKISIDFPEDLDIDGEFREEWEMFDATGTLCEPDEVAQWAIRWRTLIEKAQGEQDLNKLWPTSESCWNAPPWNWNERAACLLADLALVAAQAQFARERGVRLICESWFRSAEDDPL